MFLGLFVVRLFPIFLFIYLSLLVVPRIVCLPQWGCISTRPAAPASGAVTITAVIVAIVAALINSIQTTAASCGFSAVVSAYCRNRTARTFFKRMNNIFSSKEWEYIERGSPLPVGTPSPQSTAAASTGKQDDDLVLLGRFFELYTMKEAFVKAVGEGGCR
eukprot:GHVU01096420.1.p1 GENE.GHVU01096420.1~~GHVU01096420.1.p1  ORF type:complete len:161 (-),score=12.23 GHVU01096420.1:1526-2008(-)